MHDRNKKEGRESRDRKKFQVQKSGLKVLDRQSIDNSLSENKNQQEKCQALQQDFIELDLKIGRVDALGRDAVVVVIIGGHKIKPRHKCEVT